MSILSSIFKRRSRPSVLDDDRETNFVVIKDGKEIHAHVPLADELQRVRIDYVQTVLALARTSANTRRELAARTLINVHGKAH